MTEATPADGVMPTVYLTSYQDVSTGYCSRAESVRSDIAPGSDARLRGHGQKRCDYDASSRLVSALPPLRSSFRRPSHAEQPCFFASTLYRWLNATQILKVAGMPKTQRTKYLEKEVITGRHEKVQGGCKST